jgi:hypothetical protein
MWNMALLLLLNVEGSRSVFLGFLHIGRLILLLFAERALPMDLHVYQELRGPGPNHVPGLDH